MGQSFRVLSIGCNTPSFHPLVSPVHFDATKGLTDDPSRVLILLRDVDVTFCRMEVGMKQAVKLWLINTALSRFRCQ